MNKKDSIYKINNNDDWNSLKLNENFVDISNNAYFGFRSMEKNAQRITYDPFIVDDIVRLIKESKKFPNTTHMLNFDLNTIGFSEEINNEFFLKKITRMIEEILNLNENINLSFNIIENNKIDVRKIYKILKKIYNE